MDKRFADIIARVAPIEDQHLGLRYRCALTLKDGTFLPCAVLQSKGQRVALAKRRIKEEMAGEGVIAGAEPLVELLSVFVAGENQVNDWEVVSAAPSRFAIPLELLKKIEGETAMGWTAWVFEMKDGKMFSYGTHFRMEFFDLPEGYTFAEVARVHNHSFVSEAGDLIRIECGAFLAMNYNPKTLYRDRTFFTCYLDEIATAAAAEPKNTEEIKATGKRGWRFW